MQDVLRLKEYFTAEGILFSFNGSFTHGIIEEIGSAIKCHLEAERLEKGVISDVFAVYVEQTQNVRNYLKRKQLTSGPESGAILVIGSEGKCFTVCSGNSVEKEDVPELVARLEEINSQDKDGLKKLYRQQLRAERAPDAVGSGLGLLDIARRASGKLEYRIDPKNDRFDFFSFFVRVEGA